MDWKKFGLNALQSFVANLALGSISGKLQQIPERRLNEFMVRLGKAFGPPNLRHWSELDAEEQADWLQRVPVLATNHKDWPKPFQWVKRTLNVWIGPGPTLNDVIVGNATEMKPIPNHGEWYVIRGYGAATTVDGIHDRWGWRYDDIDSYWTFPSFKIAIFD